MLRRQQLPFHTEHDLQQVPTVRSSDSKCSAEGRSGNCRMCLQAPVFRSNSLTVCTPQMMSVASGSYLVPSSINAHWCPQAELDWVYTKKNVDSATYLCKLPRLLVCNVDWLSSDRVVQTADAFALRIIDYTCMR